MPLSYFPRRSQHYWDEWPDKVMRERFVHDSDDWNDFFDNSLISRNRRSQLERRRSDEPLAQVIEDKDKFKVKLDVSHFKPSEITVKIVDNYVVVSGKHEEVEDREGWVSRQFSRRYSLPEEYDSNKLISTVSSDGILIIEAPIKRRRITFDDNERVVPITRSNEYKNEFKKTTFDDKERVVPITVSHEYKNGFK